MANGSSWTILDGLRDNLVSYIDSNASTFNVNGIGSTVECVSYSPAQIERQMEKRRSAAFHIGLYETSPDDLLVAGGGDVLNFDQAYELSIYYLIAKDGEYDENAERLLMNMKDLVITWANGIVTANTISSITSTNLLRWQFLGSGEPEREPKYCYTTVQYLGFKNLI